MAASESAPVDVLTPSTPSGSKTSNTVDSAVDVLLELSLQRSLRGIRMKYASTVQLPAELPMLHIPRKPNILLGRNEVVEGIVSRLVETEATPAIICGGPGMGKTSVAAGVWHDERVEGRFGTGRVWISCDGLLSSEGLIPALASMLGVQDRQEGPLRNQLLQELQAREKPTFLVLDNVNSKLFNTESSQTHSFLVELAHLPYLQLLLLSKDGDVLNLGDPGESFSLRVEKLDLSALRTIYAANDGPLSDGLDELLELVDGCPLAAVLLARHCSILPTAEIIPILDQAKTTGFRGLDLCLHLLLNSSPIREIPTTIDSLSILSLFPDGIDLEQLPKAFPILGNLTASLTALERLGLISRRGSRVKVLSSIRPHVLEKHPPRTDHVKSLIQSFLSFLDPLDITEPDVTTMERITKEFGNITSVLLASFKHFDLDDRAMHPLLQLCVFRIHARYGDCYPVIKLAFDRIEHQPTSNSNMAVSLSLVLACCLLVDQELSEAATLLEKVASMSSEPQSQDARLVLYATLHLTQHRYKDAQDLLLQLPQVREHEERVSHAFAQELLAMILLRMGDLDQAASRCAAAGAAYAALEHFVGLHRCQEIRAAILAERGQFADAFHSLFELSQTYTTAEFDYAKSRVRRAMYRIHALEGRYEAALTGYADAKRRAEKAHDRFTIADCEHGSAKVYELMQQPAAALELYKLAISIFRELNEVVEVAFTRLDLGRCMCDAKLSAEGLSQMSAAMAAFDYCGLPYPSAKCKQYIGKVLASLKAVNEGLSHLRSALSTFMELNRKIDAADCYILIGGICYPGRLDEAEEATKSAMRLYDELGRAESKVNCMVILASCYRHRGALSEMIRVAQEGLGTLAGLEDRSKADEGIIQMLKGFLGHPQEPDD